MLVAGAALLLVLLCPASHAKIGYFWHITDIHYDPKYDRSGDTKSNCWRSDTGRAGGVGGASPGQLGDYRCDAPWDLVESAVRAMKSKHGDNIDFILWTGDGASHVGARGQEQQLSALQNITALLRQSFSSQFVFPVLGHEDAPGAYHNLTQLWSYWLPSEALHTMRKGGYYTIERKERKLRLILINTNLYIGVGGASHGSDDDPAGQWAWLENTLQKSLNNRETVYIVGHVPPGGDERTSGLVTPPARAVFRERFNARYLELVRRYSSIIVGQFFGHLHADCFRVVYDTSGVPVSWIMVAPAVSPRRGHGSATNPGLRLYKFDTDTGKVLDYAQYFLDLQQVAAREALVQQQQQQHQHQHHHHHTPHADEWQLEYNFTSYYGVHEISPEALAGLAEAFPDPARAKLANKYDRAASVRYTGAGGGGAWCDSACAHAHFCSATKLERAALRRCLAVAASSLHSAAGVPRPPAALVALAAAVLAAALLLCVSGTPS
ncbi:acid sphingomyelinase-like phosphodiesterase 3a [Schistocerca serialis cubense]|uniref:acid sphingomyelinase-like phosphodiesterase 3a n=1 Tax=Schistocerca serialis cubense TaxID=2023355 RepID=UPI00214EAE36|nr:acid sphingomyelinase-like phosphodiesterase 3a [Schistocerca serialis cubense]